jgi:tRNA(Ile)-lysidine synthase
VRVQALPMLEATLGPGIAESLARSAELLRADADALDALAAGFLEDTGASSEPLTVDELNGLAGAVRSRVLRTAALQAGCPPTDLSAAHVAAIDALVTAWKGQGPLSLPGGVTAQRVNGTIVLSAPTGARGSDSRSNGRRSDSS